MWLNISFGCPSQTVREDNIEMNSVPSFSVGNLFLNIYRHLNTLSVSDASSPPSRPVQLLLHFEDKDSKFRSDPEGGVHSTQYERNTYIYIYQQRQRAKAEKMDM